jgi:DNA-binding XRE family transcriptional regulator
VTVTNSPAARDLLLWWPFYFKDGRIVMLEKELQINRAMGLKIRELREASYVTRIMLASHVGVTFQQIQKIESGKNRVSAARLQLICEYLGISPMVFYALE